jgi:hypoxanthine phosphoribosyltransferase
MMKWVGEAEYVQALRRLAAQVAGAQAHCVVGIKRSGLFPAVFLSHALTLPMFACAEIDAIPRELERVLLVDTVVRTGRSIEKPKRRLLRAGHAVTVAVLYRENGSDYPADHFLESYPALVHFFYERLRWEPGEAQASVEPL